MKKLAYIANVRFPSERAHAVQMVQMCQAFSHQQLAVDFIVNDRETKIPLADLMQDSPCFSVLRIKFGILFVPYSKVFFVVNDLIFSLLVFFQLPISSYDVVYTRDEWIAIFLYPFVKTGQLVWESHEAKFNFAVRFLLRRGIKCVVISEGIADSYLRKGIPKEQLLVAHDGIDETFFESVPSKEEARKKLGLSSEATIAMYVGGLDAWKGIDTFCAAASILPNVQCVVIGGGVRLPTLKAKFPQVVFLDSRPYNELKEHQQAADVLVIPNSGKTDLSARYTSPLKLFAHLAAGIPLVLSDIPSLRVVAKNAQGVFWAQPDNPAEFATTIAEALLDTNASLRAVANKDLARNYTWSNRAKKVISFISN